MKPRILTVTATGLVAILAANPSTSSAEVFDGPYIGGSAGLFSSAVVDVKDNTFGGSVQRGLEDSLISRLDLQLGWGLRRGGVYLGPEISLALDNMEERVLSTENTSEDVEFGDSMSIGIRAGVFLNKRTVGYLKLARVETDIKYSAEVLGTSVSDEEEFTGMGIGIGVEHAVQETATVRLEAMQVDYGTEDLLRNEFAGLEGGWEVDPVELTVMLGINFHF